ncbi:MAG: PEGA domain-containing protein [Leptospirales bacterium]
MHLSIYPQKKYTSRLYSRALYFLTLFLVCLWTGSSLSAQSPPLEKKHPEGLKLKYKANYEIVVFPTIYRLNRKNIYLKNIYEGVVVDRLRLLSKGYVKKPTPVEFFYPVEGVETGGEILENPRQYILENFISQSAYFPMKIVRADNLPAEITSAEYFFSNYNALRSLDSETFYLFLTLEPAEQTTLDAGVYFYRGNKLLYHTIKTIVTENLHVEISLLTSGVRKWMAGPQSGNLSVQTIKEGASVYIDKIFSGKTPLFMQHLPAGPHEIDVYKTGHKPWKEKVTIEPGKTKSITGKLVEKWSEGVLRISSNPPEADVYVDLEYRGKTPIDVSGLETGNHRIQLVKEGFIDNYKMVKISYVQKRREIKLLLKPGNSEKHFETNPAVLGKITNQGFFKGFTIGAGGFAITGLYFLMQAENFQTNIASIKKNSGSNLSAHEQKKIKNLNTKITNYTGYYTGSFITSGVSIGIATYFFIKYLSSYNPKIVSNPKLGFFASVDLNGGFSGKFVYRW